MLLRNADAVPRVDPLFRDRVLVRAAFAGDLWGTTTFLNDVFDGRLLHVRQHGSNFENWQAQKFGLDYGYFRPSSQFDHDKFTLVAPNPDYPQITVDAGNPGHVIARATKHIRDI